MSEHDLSWMSQNPKIGFHSGIAKPVFLNGEAFWICYSGSVCPEVVDMVEWEWEDSFERYYTKEIDEKMSQDGVKSYLKNLVLEAAEDAESLEDDESIKIFQMNSTKDSAKTMTTFNSKDSSEEIQKFIKKETKEEFLQQFKPAANEEKERVKENPIERDEHGAVVLPNQDVKNVEEGEAFTVEGEQLEKKDEKTT